MLNMPIKVIEHEIKGGEELASRKVYDAPMVAVAVGLKRR